MRDKELKLQDGEPSHTLDGVEKGDTYGEGSGGETRAPPHTRFVSGKGECVRVVCQWEG